MNKSNQELRCEIVCDLLPLYHDRVVSKVTEESVSRHLAECESCQKEYQALCAELPEQSPKISTRERFNTLMRRQKCRRLLTGFVSAVLLLTVLFSLCFCIFIGNPVVVWHNRQLEKAITGLDGMQQVTLNQVVPFEWDTVYTFDPYTSRQEIAETIGFDSGSIQETWSEGMTQLLFVKDQRVTASVCGYPSRLGYDVVFEDRITADQQVQFWVETEPGRVTLIQK